MTPLINVDSLLIILAQAHLPSPLTITGRRESSLAKFLSLGPYLVLSTLSNRAQRRGSLYS